MLNFMRTMIVTGLVAVGGGTVANVAGVDVVPDQVEAIVFQQQDGTENPDRPSDEERAAIRDFIKGESAPAVAELLGVSVEELEQAKEDRTIGDLVEASGLTMEEFKEATQAIKADALQAAVDEGLITAEQAENLQNREGKRGRRGGGNGVGNLIDREEAMQTVADILGISIEELEEARAEGTRLPELIEELGLDEEAVKAELQAAKEAAVQQAVEDGTITQEQADRFLNGEGRGGRGEGRGERGNRGGNQDAPEGITNDNLDA